MKIFLANIICKLCSSCPIIKEELVYKSQKMQEFNGRCRILLVKGGIGKMTKITTKQKVVDAASLLFFQHGFHGTSVRDIAEKASVNVSLISYYFKSKQGLLEYAVTTYYELYLETMETVMMDFQKADKEQQLKEIIYAMIRYKTEHFQLTSFIHRELSLDSTFVREMTVTYLAKENHLLSKLFFNVLHPTFQKEKSYLFMQLKGMLMSPYILKNEWNNQMIDQVDIENFTKHYVRTIKQWIDFVAKSPDHLKIM